MTLPGESSLYIERLCNRYVVPDQASEEMRARCEVALAANLERTLATALESSFSAEDSSLWFVRELNVELSVGSRIEHADVGEIWAGELARVLVDALDSNQPDVLHFPDRASYLAQFLLDLAEGSAWGRWYYSIFDGLRMLSVSAAIRTAILNSVHDGLRAMHLLSERQRRVLIHAVNTADVRRLLSAFADGPGYSGNCLSPLAKHWHVGLRFRVGDEERRSLSLFLAVTKEHPEFAGRNLQKSAIAACRLASLLHDHPQGAAVLDAIRVGDLAALYKLLGTDAEPLTALLHASSDDLNELLLHLKGEPFPASAARPEMRFTAFGGAFLLLPLLDAFPFPAATADWPGMGSLSPATIVRLLILAKCFGREQAQGCMRDPVIRDLLEIPPTVSLQAIAEWQTGISPAHLQSLLQANSTWHRDAAAASIEILLLTQVAHKGAPVSLLIDCAHGMWLNAISRPGDSNPLVPVHLDLPQPAELFCHESLIELGRNAFPQSLLKSLAAADEGVLPLPSTLVRDLSYLSLLRDLAPLRAVDLVLSVVTQGVLRRFAAQLPGFGRSSLNYLNRNFLDCCAAVESSEERIVVSLAPPPLHLVLAKNSLSRRSYNLSWLNGRLCAIFPEG
ncbi:MAG: hypothetical protein BGO25_02950 [Acidobacteriales bacterium 59-55]|nr:hypothetical protein [Terriglobales bacterium]OJV42469.1 MAG: hypothetical protein BGO25_02950 [Acidobacteriales bacterium 59-55]